MRLNGKKHTMKSTLIVTSLVFLLTSFLHAQEIEVSKPFLLGKVPAKTRQFDSTARKWIEVEGLGYSFVVYLKNISDKPLTVATKGLSQQTSSGESKQNVLLDMNKLTLDGGSLVIPSREDLRLVDIRPGEAAAMNIEFTMTVPLEEIAVTYNPKDFYAGRFGYWIGKVSSEFSRLEKNK